MQSNPFGDAKPVDADAKLRELEERIQKRKVSCSFIIGALCIPSGLILTVQSALEYPAADILKASLALLF